MPKKDTILKQITLSLPQVQRMDWTRWNNFEASAIKTIAIGYSTLEVCLPDSRREELFVPLKPILIRIHVRNTGDG